LAANGAEIMIAEMSDLEVLALTAAGDQGAFSDLVKRYQDKVFGMAYRYARDRQDAEELAQEIFLKVWQHARTFKGRSAFATWLYRLAVNTCLNYRQKKKIVPEPLPLLGDFAAETNSAGSEIIAQERQNLLDKAMDTLPARQKMALILANFEGKSYEEIAGLMEVSISAVETLLFRARQNLAAMLRPLKKKGEL
ncbi:MAG: sigma-70 family RNA polymerase sigma factor, partial [Candidatus Aminicenantes bacterium]|nr:sigma-70 family RNA polymerase sigma factor [Candidatus Aminicenantes bacterium]